ncbi:hypothetical protein IWQ60_011308 [Tieghemiomyces parasiticus]|uniref:Methyltransferase domain-containing protein n=1 Tax=Tieghemiomyces parasiticus TaxID=78921 RepID=A0A9W7ZJP4_9FUNG|nr:hypothetical protein IWQ60_011308 [Tieghemiomyces parasiticus]
MASSRPACAVTSLTEFIHRVYRPAGGLRHRRILDFRPARDFAARHLTPSANFFEPTFNDCRYCQLPAKHQPLDILVPYGHSTDRPWDQDAHMLAAKGWAVEHIVPVKDSWADREPSAPVDPDPGWAEAARLGVLGSCGSEGGPTASHVVFDPCPPLARHITDIEMALQGPSLTDATSRTVLDLGCGSGRDLAWLCSRSLRELATGQGRSSVVWKGLGLDSVRGALRRTRLLADQLGVGSHVVVGHGKFHSDGLFYLKSDLADPVLGNPPPSIITGGPPLFTTSDRRTRDTPSIDPPRDLSFQFDLVLGVRFLNRGLFTTGQISQWIAPGGFLLYSTFVDLPEFPDEHPHGFLHRLGPGELAGWFGPGTGYEVLDDRVECIEDGRHVVSFLARKNLG